MDGSVIDGHTKPLISTSSVVALLIGGSFFPQLRNFSYERCSTRTNEPRPIESVISSFYIQGRNTKNSNNRILEVFWCTMKPWKIKGTGGLCIYRLRLGAL
mmetsp:Transcript_1984/g.3812  ORF Transcript_1984/g.3812 Transcript_1984/m.3812 type:complete len:101 (-) Transcript_1984:1582-1884(-)